MPFLMGLSARTIIIVVLLLSVGILILSKFTGIININIGNVEALFG